MNEYGSSEVNLLADTYTSVYMYLHYHSYDICIFTL